MAAGVLAVVAQYERRLIGARTREAMAAAKARGVRFGRPVEHSPTVRQLVVSMRESGATLQQIADRLTDARVATPRGGRWHLSTVKRILDSHRLDVEASEARDHRRAGDPIQAGHHQRARLAGVEQSQRRAQRIAAVQQPPAPDTPPPWWLWGS